MLEPGQMAGCGLRTLKGVSSSQRHLWDDPLARVSALNSLFPSAPYSDLKLAKYRRLSMTSLSPPERRGSVNPLIGHHLLEHVEIPVELAKRSVRSIFAVRKQLHKQLTVLPPVIPVGYSPSPRLSNAGQTMPVNPALTA